LRVHDCQVAGRLVRGVAVVLDPQEHTEVRLGAWQRGLGPQIRVVRPLLRVQQARALHLIIGLTGLDELPFGSGGLRLVVPAPGCRE
jgi:hypothetical protein